MSETKNNPPQTPPAVTSPEQSAKLEQRLADMEKRLAEAEARAAAAEREIGILSDQVSQAGQTPAKKKLGPITVDRDKLTQEQQDAIRTYHVSALNRELDTVQLPIEIEAYTHRDAVCKFKDAVGIEPYKLLGVKAVEVESKKKK